MSATQDVLDRLEKIRAETLKRFVPLTQPQLDWHPTDGEWSLGEIFHHIALVEMTHIGGLEAMSSLEWLEGYGGHEAFHHQQIDEMITQLKEHDIN
ncbi:MAG TPA: DinB family protein [Anaerolineales bacterium]|nr:DinB family protein [Anaerolineales bacterium]